MGITLLYSSLLTEEIISIFTALAAHPLTAKIQTPTKLINSPQEKYVLLKGKNQGHNPKPKKWPHNGRSISSNIEKQASHKVKFIGVPDERREK
jgi:hypothetical protein